MERGNVQESVLGDKIAPFSTVVEKGWG